MYTALAGFYQPGLKYEAAKAAAAQIPAATRALVLGQALKALPTCYDQPFHECLQDRPSTFGGCAQVMEGYAVDWDAMDKAVAKIQYCPKIAPLTLFGGGLALVALGVGIGVLVSK